ncbi:MAG: serine/threonine protein kinase [Deltaproteobacteria bacterium]|nr:serine/threonine protein kinase [Deltaproteobacteria bacterium]
MIPPRIGKYAVVRKIASGGMAEIYLCRLSGEEGFEKRVAVKVIHPRFSEDRRFRDLFAREARIAASLSHQNLIQVFDFGREGEAYYLAMEFVNGWNLAQVASQVRMRSLPVPLPVWRYWVEGILSGIGYLHSRGIVHRDISPSNVLVSRAGAVKITDFGISRSVRGEAAAETGREGKFCYMSPEQARGEEAGAASDLFAAAVVAAELFLPARLFDGGSEEEILSRLRRFDAQALDLGGLPLELTRALRKGLANRREDRYEDAASFLRAVCSAVPLAEGRTDLPAYWDSLFQGAGTGEEDTVVADPPPGSGKGDILRDKRESYGEGGRRFVRIAALSALALFSAGGWILWEGLAPDDRLRGDHSPRSSAPAIPGGPSASPTASSAVRTEAPALPVVSALPLSAHPSLADHSSPSIPSSGPPAAPAAPATPPKKVLLETDPAGVNVSLEDGTPLGRTPLSLDPTPWAGKKIFFQQEGYAGKSVSADVLRHLQNFRLELERQMGTVEVIQAIPWAKVYDGERYLGETPISSVTIPVGERRIRVVNEPLGVDKVMTVTVRPGSNPKLIIPLVGK